MSDARRPLGAITGRQPTVDGHTGALASHAKCGAAAATDTGRPNSSAPLEVCRECPVTREHCVDAPALTLRPPCDRPRCRARRLALRLARRDAAEAYARLVLRAWSCHVQLERQRRERLYEQERHEQQQQQWQHKQQQWQKQEEWHQALLQLKHERQETRELRRDARRERKEEQREQRRQERRAKREQERSRLLDERQRRHDSALDAVLLERRTRRASTMAEADAESRSRRASPASAPLGPGRLMWRLMTAVAFAGALCSRWGGAHHGDD